jgi:hypothetical protein
MLSVYLAKVKELRLEIAVAQRNILASAYLGNGAAYLNFPSPSSPRFFLRLLTKANH